MVDLVNAYEVRQAWCLLQVKLCDPCLSALKWSVYHARRYTSARLYRGDVNQNLNFNGISLTVYYRRAISDTAHPYHGSYFIPSLKSPHQSINQYAFNSPMLPCPGEPASSWEKNSTIIPHIRTWFEHSRRKRSWSGQKENDDNNHGTAAQESVLSPRLKTPLVILPTAFNLWASHSNLRPGGG